MQTNRENYRIDPVGARRVPRWLSLSLAICLCTGPVQAFPFFHARKSTPESLPPAAQAKPNFMQPPATPLPLNPAFVPYSPIQLLVNNKIFPPDAIERTRPITRAEWAAVLVAAIHHNTQLVSEFPFYRDVPLDHPSYVPIEVAREKKLLTYEAEHGFYYPDRPLTYAEAYESLAQAITGPQPPAEMLPHLLQGFKDRAQLKPVVAESVGKMARVYFFREPVPQTELHPNALVTYEGATPLVSYLIHLIQRRSPLQSELEAAVPMVPPGLPLVLSPSTAILEAQLTVGQSVSFNLVNAVGPLPKESHFQGQVTAAIPASRSYTVQLTSVKTPEGNAYQTQAQFTLGFNPRSRITFFVPGELFNATTQLPPQLSSSRQVPNTPGLPPAPSSTGVQNSIIPPFNPPASPATGKSTEKTKSTTPTAPLVK